MPDTVSDQLGIAVELRIDARDMLPSALAEIANRGGDVAGSDQLAAVARDSETVSMVRTVHLPAVPRAGETLIVAPYWEALEVEAVIWMTDPEPGDAQVALHLEDVDLDVVGAAADAIEAFIAAGWIVD